MCGICGIVGVADEELARQMARRMEHRGPDGEGVAVLGPRGRRSAGEPLPTAD